MDCSQTCRYYYVIKCLTNLYSFISLDPASVRILRFLEPEVGWRKIPDMNRPEEGKVEVKGDSTFHIDTESGAVTVTEGSTKLPVGPKMVYMLS